MSDIVQHITPPKAAELNMRGIIRDQADTIASLTADNKRMRAALCVCELELNAYYRRLYPGDHPYSQRELAQAMASNPATVALTETSNDQA